MCKSIFFILRSLIWWLSDQGTRTIVNPERWTKTIKFSPPTTVSLWPLLLNELDSASLFGLDFASSIGFRLSVNLVRMSSSLILLTHINYSLFSYSVSLSFFLFIPPPPVASTIECRTHSRWPIHAPCMAPHCVGHYQLFRHWSMNSCC